MKEILKNKKNLILLLIILISIISIIAIVLIRNNQDDGERKVNESDMKSEFTTFQKELDNYLASLDVSKYNPNLICADSNDIICGTVKIENSNIYNIIPSLKKSIYKDLVNVANGKLEVKALTEEEINILKEFLDLAKYDYSYCISEYREAKGLNITNVVESIPVIDPMIE